MIEQIKELKIVEKDVSKKFGDLKILYFYQLDQERVSMPGMMDTILNLGLNDKTVVDLQKKLLMEDLQRTVIEDLFKCMETL